MSWKREKLKNVCEFIDGDRGKNYPSNGELFDNGDCLFLNTGNVTATGFDFTSCQFIADEKDRALRKGKLLRGDVVLTTRGTLGHVAYYSDAIPFDRIRINSGMLIARSSVHLLPNYLFYAFRDPMFQAMIDGVRSGSAQPQLPAKTLKEMTIPVPTLEEQKRIADILSAYDKLIENNRRQIALLEEATQRLYKEWFVDLRFPGYEIEPIIDGLPEGWRKGKLDEIVEFRRGKTITQNETLDGDVPVVAGGLKPAYYHAHANTTSPVITVSGSGANAGFCRLYTTEIWASDCSFADSSMTDNLYFAYASIKVLSNGFKQCQRGSAQPHVYPKHVNALDVVIPDGVCLSAFNDVAKALYSQIGILNERVSAAREARDHLLPKLMSGEIEVG